jgi:large subunit ribosomal protein L17
MRHRKVKGRLNRRTSWRKATLQSLTNDLITYERIETTLAKAKALRNFAEPLITMAKKDDSISAKRRAFARLCNRRSVKKLFDDVAPLFKSVAGGYTRIMASATRKGDGAQLAVIELTRRTISDDDLLGVKEDKKAKGRKSGKPRGMKGKKGVLAKKKAGKASSKGTKNAETEEKHVAPEVDAEKREERVVEDIKKEKAKSEQKKVSKKGIFKRFRRKSI